MDESNPGRYTGDRNYLDRYHGWEASEVIRDLGFVRADGETLIGQPHLRDERRWTLSDIRGHDLHVRQPEHPGRAGARAAVRRLEPSQPSMSPRVRFEPIGEEIDCAPEETVLDAAFRQGYNLVYGCREGQCSACKCFLLEGDVALKRYSSFALSDSERANGYSLMCRAMPEDDVVVELLHYDPDGYRLEHAIRDGTGVGRGRRAADSTTSFAWCCARRGVRLHARPVRRPVGARRPAARGDRSRWPTCPATVGSS